MSFTRFIFVALGLWQSYFISLITSSASGRVKTFTRPRVLVLSVGGFREDYLTQASCLTLKRFIQNGIKAEYVQNSINTASLVNHYSVATGLFPESHGIISSTMLDPTLDKVFNKSTRNNTEWWKNVHPVWKENEKQHKAKSGVCHWPGVYGSMLPKFNCEGKRESLKHDLDRVLEWFTKKDVNLALLYTDAIKKAALKWGPHSKETINEVVIFDFLMSYLLKRIHDIGLRVNIILTSDQGVTDLHWNDIIDLDGCINPKSYVLINSQGTLLIYPKHHHSTREVYKSLKKCKRLDVYLKEELPWRYHFSNHRRIPPVVAFVPIGAIVRSSKNSHRHINEILKGPPGTPKELGGTGYNPDYTVMTSVFYANGPSFRSGVRSDPIKNTDIYNLICKLLGIFPRPNNGSVYAVKSMLTNSALSIVNVKILTEPSATPSGDIPQPTGRRISNDVSSDIDIAGLFWFLVVCTTLLFLFCCIGCICTMRSNKKHCKKTSVHPPASQRLLDSYSTDDE